MAEIDVMAFGAHPDDVELGCGGTLIKLHDAGCSIVMVDLTRGELSTRGTVETRREEAAAAAGIIGAMARENLELEDGNIRLSAEAKRRVVSVVRKYRPRLVFLPYREDRHPDHCHASELVYESLFLSGLTRYKTGRESYRPSKVAYYMGWYDFEPTFIVDISGQFERKMEAIYAYETQFTTEHPAYEETKLTSSASHRMLVSRMMYYGSVIGKEYGEGFLIRGRLEVEDPLKLNFSTF